MEHADGRQPAGHVSTAVLVILQVLLQLVKVKVFVSLCVLSFQIKTPKISSNNKYNWFLVTGGLSLSLSVLVLQVVIGNRGADADSAEFEDEGGAGRRPGLQDPDESRER